MRTFLEILVVLIGLVWISTFYWMRWKKKSITRLLEILNDHAGQSVLGRELGKRIGAEGTIYYLLSQMEDEGLIESFPEEYPSGYTPRRCYQITSLGVTCLGLLHASK